ncbi:unnamed protein product [Toxocara canis]|uniref:Moesin/ezrin/radixin homolog 1 n=1 Tax=Toxocara canis TaxID=6265 RepID=A0A183UX99_TOXCA|nr:unnamed protein product [Toxocara canis]
MSTSLKPQHSERSETPARMFAALLLRKFDREYRLGGETSHCEFRVWAALSPPLARAAGAGGMPGDTSLVASSIFGRISARSSLMSSRDYKATVQLLDDNETIYQEFKKNADAQQILDYVCEFLNIVEKDYFGLRYQDINKYRRGFSRLLPEQVFRGGLARLLPERVFEGGLALLLPERVLGGGLARRLPERVFREGLACLLPERVFGGGLALLLRERYWVDLNKPISKQVRGPNVGLRFRVRFYPSDVTLLKEEITRYQLFVQLQRDLLHGRLYCPQNEAAVLGALILQSVIGDYDAEPRSPGYVSEYKLLLKQTAKIEEKIAEAHKLFKGLTAAEAEMEFLKKASKLDTYGFDPYAVTDKQGQTLYVGVTHRGIYIYHVSRMIHHITWEELEKVDYLGKSLFIAPVASYVSPYATSVEDLNGNTKSHISKSSSTLKLHCPSATFAKHLWRHILSQQAFFTENDAKHVKPKPRIPLLSRGSTFRFPTARVLHEIELEGCAKREGPQPSFTRYTLQRQPPRQQHVTVTNKYHTLPAVSLNNGCNMTIPENEPIVDLSVAHLPQEMSAPVILETEEESASDSAAVSKECLVSEHVDMVLTPPVKWLKHPSLKRFMIAEVVIQLLLKRTLTAGGICKLKAAFLLPRFVVRCCVACKTHYRLVVTIISSVVPVKSPDLTVTSSVQKVTPSGVEKAVCSKKPRKAAGPDRVRAEEVRAGAPAEERKLAVTRCAAKRRMLGINRLQRIPSGDLRSRSGVKDIAEMTSASKHTRVDHVARKDDNRWTERTVKWCPQNNCCWIEVQKFWRSEATKNVSLVRKKM